MYTVERLSEATGWSEKRIRELAARADDPLPLLYPPDGERGGIVLKGDFEEWLHRCGRQFKERKGIK